MPKQLKIVLILILLSVLAAAVFRHKICRVLIEEATTRITGLNLSIEELNLDILKNSLYLRGITLHNPEEFDQPALARIEELSIKYDLLGSLGGTAHLRRVKAEVSEINIVKNEKGNSNLSSFSPNQQSGEPAGENLAVSVSAQKPETEKSSRRPKFLIDSLELSLDRVVFTDYAAEIGKPAVIIFISKGPQRFKNVSEFSYVFNSVSAKGGFSNLLTEY